MLSKNLSTRIMKQEIQLSSETHVQNMKRKIINENQKKHQAKLENIRCYLRRTNQAKKPESRTWII